MNNDETQNTENLQDLIITEFYSKYNIHNFKPYQVNLKCNKRSLDSLIDYKNKNFINTKLDKRSLDNLIDHVKISINNKKETENIKENFEDFKDIKVYHEDIKENIENVSIKRSKSSNTLYNNLINDINKKYQISKSPSETNLQIDNYIEELQINFISYKDKFKKKKENKKKISFCESVGVILIPTKEEYKSVGLNKVLWFSNNDYRKFKNEFIYKLRNNFTEYDVKSIAVKSPIINNRKKI